MNVQIEHLLDQYQNDLYEIQQRLHSITQMLTSIDETASILHILSNDMFISYEILKMKETDTVQPTFLYKEINHTFFELKRKYEDFVSKQHDIECLYALYNVQS